MNPLEMTGAINRRQIARSESAVAEVVLLVEILKTLPEDDPLHSTIRDLLSDESEPVDTWNVHYDQVMVEARRKIM